MGLVQDSTLRKMHQNANMSPAKQAFLHSQSSRGTAGFLSVPRHTEMIAEDAPFTTAVMLRAFEPYAGVPPPPTAPPPPAAPANGPAPTHTATNPSTTPAAHNTTTTTHTAASAHPQPNTASSTPTVANPTPPVPRCPNVSAVGEACGCTLDERCIHARICAWGGGVVRRHNAVVRALATVITEATGARVHLEKREAELTRIFRGQPQQGQMDIVVVDYGAKKTYIDVTVVSPVQANEQFMAEAANKPGHAAIRAERAKRQRYPHRDLIPFAIELGGRPGPSATRYIRSLFTNHAEHRDHTAADAWTCISTALQTAVAMQVLAAHSK